MNLKQKSEDNLKAANLLVNGVEPYCCSSIHCSYYSVIQLMKYILCSKCAIDYDKQDEEKSSLKLGTHVYVFNKIFELTPNFTHSEEDIHKIYKNFEKLKKYRIESDYKNLMTTKSLSLTGLRLSNELNNLLISIYKVS